MKEQRITIRIDSHGQISADATGFVGDACLAELERLLESLSPATESIERKQDDHSAGTSATRTQRTGRKPS